MIMVGFLVSSMIVPRGTSAQVQITNLTSYRVSGSVNFSNPGSESFWQSIPWTNVSLSASVTPGGGHTPSLLVKSANDGYNINMLFSWNATAGASYLASNEVYKAPNGSLLALTPALTQNVTQLFYNSTYYYPDRVAMLWFLDNSTSRQQSPQMMLGSDGAITGGAANIWHWQSNPTDNNANDTGYPGGYVDPSGKSLLPADNLSFAEDDYTNTTGFFVVGAGFPGAPNLDPYSSPYLVLVGNQYAPATKTWTVEMTRTFTTDAPNHRVQLATGSSYFAAFAVWQGRLGESSDMKSVSQWYNLTVSDQPFSSTALTPQGSGVSLETALAVAAGTLLVGFVVGSVLRWGTKETKV
jgi:hypothetical protein